MVQVNLSAHPVALISFGDAVSRYDRSHIRYFCSERRSFPWCHLLFSLRDFMVLQPIFDLAACSQPVRHYHSFEETFPQSFRSIMPFQSTLHQLQLPKPGIVMYPEKWAVRMCSDLCGMVKIRRLQILINWLGFFFFMLKKKNALQGMKNRMSNWTESTPSKL